MQGFITERELSTADQVFPGIAAFFAALVVKPRTFLELVCVFDNWCDAAKIAASAGGAGDVDACGRRARSPHRCGLR